MDTDESECDALSSEEQEIAAIIEALDDVRNDRLVPLRDPCTEVSAKPQHS
jgi:hypothetical protein